jgi:hypothetical protein
MFLARAGDRRPFPQGARKEEREPQRWRSLGWPHTRPLCAAAGNSRPLCSARGNERPLCPAAGNRPKPSSADRGKRLRSSRLSKECVAKKADKARHDRVSDERNPPIVVHSLGLWPVTASTKSRVSLGSSPLLASQSLTRLLPALYAATASPVLPNCRLRSARKRADSGIARSGSTDLRATARRRFPA